MNKNEPPEPSLVEPQAAPNKRRREARAFFVVTNRFLSHASVGSVARRRYVLVRLLTRASRTHVWRGNGAPQW
eukprot:999186-Prorocentrum_minimum.AAC.1